MKLAILASLADGDKDGGGGGDGGGDNNNDPQEDYLLECTNKEKHESKQ